MTSLDSGHGSGRQKGHHHLNLLLQLHRLAATVEGSIPASGHNKLCTAFLTNISLPNLIRHLYLLNP